MFAAPLRTAACPIKIAPKEQPWRAPAVPVNPTRWVGANFDRHCYVGATVVTWGHVTGYPGYRSDVGWLLAARPQPDGSRTGSMCNVQGRAWNRCEIHQRVRRRGGSLRRRFPKEKMYADYMLHTYYRT